GWDNPILHERGVISMARSKQPDSASSQFFILQQDAPHLDGSYAAFGRVVEGMDVVDAVCRDARPVDNNGTISPEEQPRILSIKRTD
ncbi:MAG: peptidylprolyl isomerase, partial [Solobacterium sp.]|nr:peptidylprolyl isomerase [Solobacterium sp.]